jgi:hypothetical protein
VLPIVPVTDEKGPVPPQHRPLSLQLADPQTDQKPLEAGLKVAERVGAIKEAARRACRFRAFTRRATRF